MQRRWFAVAPALALLGLAVSATPSRAAPTAVSPPDPVGVARAADKLIGEENAGKTTKDAGGIEDLAFLRRITLDLIGRIPTETEIQKYMALPAAERRTKAIDELMTRDQFADRWAVFFGDMLRVRSGADGGPAFQAFVHEAVRQNMPYDVLARRLIAASGKANAQPETGFLLADDADPMALTGVIAQVFLGMRVSCAQCHNHPFDKWTREEFYDVAAYFGKTRRVEHRVKMQILGIFLTEQPQNVIMWPPEDKAKGKTRTVVKPSFPFPLDEGDGPNKHIARLTAMREQLAAAAKAKAASAGNSVDDLLDSGADKALAGKGDPLDVTAEAKAAVKKIDLQGDLYRASDMRKDLAELITNPRNRGFSRNMVNRVWGELVGRGFVNPIDDFRDDNPPSHPKALDYLADEFVASGYDFRFLVKAVVNSAVYQRGHLPMSVPAPERLAAEKAFTATPIRRMLGEAMFDSIVSAGHLFTPKHRPGENMTTITTYVQVPVGVKEDPKKPLKPLAGGTDTAMAGKPGMAARGAFDLEQGVEVDFKDALKKKDGLDVDKMNIKSSEEIEAEMMMKSGNMPGRRVRYTTKEVKTEIDDNVRFNSSMRMASPAPVGHFLRVFGQTDRGALDEKRDQSPSMRAALMMLNGKLTNEAARVGALEPMHALLTGEKPDQDKAISLAYREILTREPTAAELAEAKTILKDGATILDGMADLRWVLLNSNEFRFLP